MHALMRGTRPQLLAASAHITLDPERNLAIEPCSHYGPDDAAHLKTWLIEQRRGGLMVYGPKDAE